MERCVIDTYAHASTSWGEGVSGTGRRGRGERRVDSTTDNDRYRNFERGDRFDRGKARA